MVLQALDPGSGSLILLALLIAAFVVAFKIMEMVFETILASVLSGLFYVALSYFFNYTMSIERVLLFAFIGATLYMGYSFLISVYSIGSTVLSIPYRMLKWLIAIPLGLGKDAYVYLRKKYRLKQLRDSEDYVEKQDGGGSKDVKEVVLDKVRDTDEE